MEKLAIRNVVESDNAILRYMAGKCSPLDVHTLYTYWIICKFYSKGSFILLSDDQPAGYIMSIETGEEVFVWQIGLLSEYRGKGYSNMLIDKVISYARAMNKNVGVSIALANKASYGAFSSYCRSNGLSFENDGSLSIRDMIDSSNDEDEQIYKIVLHK